MALQLVHCLRHKTYVKQLLKWFEKNHQWKNIHTQLAISNPGMFIVCHNIFIYKVDKWGHIRKIPQLYEWLKTYKIEISPIATCTIWKYNKGRFLKNEKSMQGDRGIVSYTIANIETSV